MSIPSNEVFKELVSEVDEYFHNKDTSQFNSDDQYS